METSVTLHLTKAEARALLTRVLENGEPIVFLPHARNEMAKDRLTDAEVRKALIGGEVGGAYRRRDARGKETWRHKISHRLCEVVISFEMVEQAVVVVVTAWRKK